MVVLFSKYLLSMCQKKKLKKKSSIPPQQAFLLILMFSFHIGERAFRRAGQSYAKTGSQELLIP